MKGYIPEDNLTAKRFPVFFLRMKGISITLCYFRRVFYIRLFLYFPQGGSTRTNEELWVDGSEAFAEEIKAIVGENNYKQ